MKTSTLTGAGLNRAVAMALGHEVVLYASRQFPNAYSWVMLVEGITTLIPNYAGDIAAAWPIIKEHKIDLEFTPNGIQPGCEACIHRYGGGTYWTGWDLDPQIAAMRCFIASVYGDDIDLETT